MASSDLDNNLPDWEHYSATELEQALAGLDRRRYPKRAPLIERLLKQRKLQALEYEDEARPFWSELPNWERYSLDELHQALEGLDCKRYPDREQIIGELIRAKSSD